MNAKVSPMRRLRAARTATRNALSSMLRLARPLDGGARHFVFEAHTMVRIPADRASALATPLYPSDTR